MPPLKSPFPEEAVLASAREFPNRNELPFDFGSSFTFLISSAADTMTPWGPTTIAQRDRELRNFYPTENLLSSAVGGVAMRNAAFEWKVEGPKYTRDAVTRMLHSCLSGNTFGWMPFIEALTVDLETQDNGAFIEVIRAEDDPGSPVVGLGHLDAASCQRTSSIEFPVVYTDEKGNPHKLAWYQVIPISDLPSPNFKMRGAGLCAVSRVLRMSQILKDLAVYKHEKISGRFARAIHFVGGASRKDIEDIEKRSNEEADNKGLTRFMMPMILTSLDPEKPVSHVEIPLASLPDGFDMDIEMKWYIASIALGFGGDYQDFAPLPGGNLGSSTQSEILHRKSRGKGPAFFMNFIRDTFTYRGVIPRTVSFAFYEQDLAADKERAQLSQIRATTRSLQMRSGEINQAIARKLAIRTDDLEEEDVSDELLREADVVKPQTYIGAGQNNLNSKNPSADMNRSALSKAPGPKPAVSKGIDEEEGVIVVRMPKTIVNVPKQDPPNVLVQIPQQKESPAVIKLFEGLIGAIKQLVATPPNVLVQIPQQKETQVNVTVPVPSVNVSLPKKRREKQKIHRGADGNIESTETTTEYEKE